MCDSTQDGGGALVPCAQAPELYLGSSAPKTEGAFTTRVKLFDRIQLSGLVDFKRDFQRWDVNYWVRCSIFRTCRENFVLEDYDPAYVAGVQNGAGGRYLEPYIRDASFMKLREVSASYRFPERYAQRIGASTASFTLAGRNLHTWSNYSGLDPESVIRRSNSPAAMWDQALTPQLAQLITTINVTF
jgi:hypothetical protein